jgi:hypothetical protein
MDAVEEARKRSVDNLQRLYTVVISLAVTELLKRLLVDPSTRAFKTPSLIEGTMLISFVFTIVPFYHGANRYLDATYVTKERTPQNDALMIDFVFLFGEALLTFALAMSCGNIQNYYLLFILLLLYDLIWVFSTQYTSKPNEGADSSYKKWLVINVIAIVIIFLLGWSKYTSLWPNDDVRSLFLVAMGVLRTILDYVVAWKFYFPELMQDNETPKIEEEPNE